MFTVCCVSCKYLFLGFILGLLFSAVIALFSSFLPVVPSISFFLVPPHASLFFLICSWPSPPRSLYFLLSSCSSLVHFSSCFHSSFFLFRFSSSTLIPCLFHFSCFSSRFFSIRPHLLLALSSFTLFISSSAVPHFTSAPVFTSHSLFRFSSSTLIPCLFHFSCFSSRFSSVFLPALPPHLLLCFFSTSSLPPLALLLLLLISAFVLPLLSSKALYSSSSILAAPRFFIPPPPLLFFFHLFSSRSCS